MSVEQQILSQGLVVDRNQVAKLINDFYQELCDKNLEDLRLEAKERCNRVSDAMKDRNQENGLNSYRRPRLFSWMNSLSSPFISMCTIF